MNEMKMDKNSLKMTSVVLVLVIFISAARAWTDEELDILSSKLIGKLKFINSFTTSKISFQIKLFTF